MVKFFFTTIIPVLFTFFVMVYFSTPEYNQNVQKNISNFSSLVSSSFEQAMTKMTSLVESSQEAAPQTETITPTE